MTELPMIQYTARVWMNVSEEHFLRGYKPHHPLAAVRWSSQAPNEIEEPFEWYVSTALGERAAAEMMFVVGNREGDDDCGQSWPSDIRSLSVGDLVEIRGGGQVAYLAVAHVGYDDVPEPTNTRVPIEGSYATSRVAS